MGLAADTGVAGRETGPGHQLHQIVNFFPLREGVEEERHRPEVHPQAADHEKVRGDAGQLAADHPDGFAAGGEFPSHEFLDRQGVGDVIGNRGEIVQPVGVGDELVVLHVLGDLFIPPVEVADLGSRLGHHLAGEFHDQAQDAMRGGMRGAHVEDQLLAHQLAGFLQSLSAAPQRILVFQYRRHR